jgi:hypothetical protein
MDAVQSVPIDYATGGYGPADVTRITRENELKNNREQASFLTYLNAVAAGATQEQLAQINPMEHYMRTGDRFMPVGDEMLRIGEGQFQIPGMVKRAGLKRDIATKGMENVLANLELGGQETARKTSEVWKKNPMQQALETMSPDDAMKAILMQMKVPEFYGTGKEDIPTKYGHETAIKELELKKQEELTKLGWAKLGETSGFHQGTLANAGARTAQLGDKQSEDSATRLLRILMEGAGNPMLPGATGMNQSLEELMAEVLANRKRPQVGGPGQAQPSGADQKQILGQLTKQLNAQHSSAAIGSTTSADIGGQTIHFMKTRTGWIATQ